MSPSEHEKKLAEELRLRPERTIVTRLSRKVLITLAGLSSSLVLGLTLWALHERSSATPPPELYNTEAKTTADGLAALPRDYTGLPKNVPKLGPPLPGDLGRPILAAQGQLPQATVDPEEQRMGQEREAARTAKLFTATNTHERVAATSEATHSLDRESLSRHSPFSSESPPIDPGAILNMQDRKLAFVIAPADRRTVSSDRMENPASRYVLQAGAVIPADDRVDDGRRAGWSAVMRLHGSCTTDQGAPRFDHEWQRRAFGLAIALSEFGHYRWEDFQRALIETIGRWERAPEFERGDWDYYDHWVAALQKVIDERGLLTTVSVSNRHH